MMQQKKRVLKLVVSWNKKNNYLKLSCALGVDSEAVLVAFDVIEVEFEVDELTCVVVVELWVDDEILKVELEVEVEEVEVDSFDVVVVISSGFGEVVMSSGKVSISSVISSNGEGVVEWVAGLEVVVAGQ